MLQMDTTCTYRQVDRQAGRYTLYMSRQVNKHKTEDKQMDCNIHLHRQTDTVQYMNVYNTGRQRENTVVQKL